MVKAAMGNIIKYISKWVTVPPIFVWNVMLSSSFSLIDSGLQNKPRRKACLAKGDCMEQNCLNIIGWKVAASPKIWNCTGTELCVVQNTSQRASITYTAWTVDRTYSNFFHLKHLYYIISYCTFWCFKLMVNRSPVKQIDTSTIKS